MYDACLCLYLHNGSTNSIYLVYIRLFPLYTGLFEMVVGVLTTCLTQYT